MIRNRLSHCWLLAGLLLAAAAGCIPSVPNASNARTLTVMTHDSFAISEAVVAQFESQQDVQLVFLQSGDTGAALNRAILTKTNPQADLFFGVDNTFLSRALEEDIFEPYLSPGLADVADEFILDQEGRVTPVDFGDVCINYDKAYFEENKLGLPNSLADLTKPGYRDLLVVQNPTSSPGLAFLLATVAAFGPDHYLDYWKDLRNNGLVVVNDWETAYYTNFSASSGGGAQPMAVSYASSPAAEVVFAETELADAPTGVLIGPGMCFRQVEFVGILKGTPNRDLAEKWIDFMLSPTFQEDIPLQMFVYPVNKLAKLPEVFDRFGAVPDAPARLAPEVIATNRDAWIEAWTEVVLR